MSENNQELEELKIEATELGISFSPNIGQGKLKDKIEAHYAAQETSGSAVDALVAQNANKSKGSAGGTKSAKSMCPKAAKRMSREKAARKTRVVTIVDNDQRQNNHTSTCTVNCSNEFFDLGTRHLPLGEKIEVAQGHIDVLKDVYIPIHTRGKNGLAITKNRARYSISYEDTPE